MSFRVFFWMLVFFIAVPTQAATLYIDPNTATLNRGDSVSLNVRLDVDENSNECINTIDAVISYDESVIPVDVSTGQSILSFWVETPTIHRDTHTITFASGIPNGYCGRVEGDPKLTNSIATLIFRAPGLQVGGGEERKQAVIKFLPETTAYLNDGAGTKANLRLLDSTLKLNDSIGANITDDWRTIVQSDNIPPEEFSISLQRDEKTFSGRYYIVFNTTDKQTGIDSYEVMEEPLNRLRFFDYGAVNIPWEKTETTVYKLKDQSLNSSIRVKAIDKAGNEYVAVLVPDQSIRSNNWLLFLPTIIASLIFILILVFGLGWVVWQRRYHKIIKEDLNQNDH